MIYGGKGPLKDRVIQVAALGTADESVLETFLQVLGQAVQSIALSTRSRSQAAEALQVS